VTLDRRRAFEEAFPRGFYVDPTDGAGIETYARMRKWLRDGETLASVAKAGEGNMNLTLRLVTTGRSLILKQARPWVEKYPHIEAPPERARVEIAFYETVRSREALRGAMPELLGADPDSGALLLEDLGEAQDFTCLYRGSPISGRELDALVDYLVALHQPLAGTSPLFENRAMRALNHAHIFRIPLEAGNGLDLDAITPGLAEAAQELQRDSAYVKRVHALGEVYLEDGPCLVHGDYFPGSWLSTPSGPRIIDPEFCFLGAPAFDVGVMLAHLHLARQDEATAASLLRLYRERRESDDELARRLAGVEIMRRLIGVAQLPLSIGLDEKAALLSLSRELVLSS
jgi:5-methylthioribose kinase